MFIKQFLCICLLSTLLIACDDAKQQGPAEPQVKTVKTVVVGEAEGVVDRQYPASVRANQQTALAFQVDGQLIEFPIANGEQVKTQQLLGKLDDRDYQHALDEENAKLDRHRTEYLRYKQLVAKGAVPRTDYDEKKAAYAIAQARVQIAQKALDDTVLHAPFTGQVANTFVDNFENVKAKQVVLNLQEIDHIEVVVNIPEQDLFFAELLDEIKVGHDKPEVATVTFESMPDTSYIATFKEMTTEADELTQTYEIVLSMENPAGVNVFPGMTATVVPILDETGEGGYFIPSGAVFEDAAGNPTVWVVDTDTMTVNPQQVTTGDLKQELIYVTGLKSGDTVVATGAHLLLAGDQVRLFESLVRKQ